MQRARWFWLSVLVTMSARGETYQYYPAEVLGQGLANLSNLSPEAALFTNPSLPHSEKLHISAQGQGLSQAIAMAKMAKNLNNTKELDKATQELLVKLDNFYAGEALTVGQGLDEHWAVGVQQFSWGHSEIAGEILPIINATLISGLEGIISYRGEDCSFCQKKLPDLSWGVSLKPYYKAAFVVDQKDVIQIYEDRTLINPRYATREALGLGLDAAMSYEFDFISETLTFSALLRSSGVSLPTSVINAYGKPRSPEASHLLITSANYEFGINPNIQSAVSYALHLGGVDMHHIAGKIFWQEYLALVGGWSTSEGDLGILAKYLEFQGSLVRRTMLGLTEKGNQSVWLAEIGYSF